MEKLISYICGDLNMLKHDMALTARNFKRQGRTNRGFALLFVLVGGYICWNELQDDQLKKEIESLTKEVEELKKSKGE